MREQGVVWTVFTGRLLGGSEHFLTKDLETARRGNLKTRNHAEGGGLSAARWSEQRKELAVTNIKVDAVNRRTSSKSFEMLRKETAALL